VPEGEPQIEPQEFPQEDPLEAGIEFSPQPNPGAARGRRDEVTPAKVGFREEEGEGRLRRELNLREAQISALERELAKLKAQSRTSRASTLFEEDDYRPRPKYEKPKTFNGEYSPLYNLLNWLHSMKNYCSQHKCRPEDMVGLARTYMGPDVQTYLDAKYKGNLPDDWEELEETLRLRYMPLDHKVRVEIRFDSLRQRSSLQAYVDEFQKVDAAFSFAQMEIAEERKVLVFIRGIKEREDRRYMMHERCHTLDECYEAAMYLRQTKVMDEGVFWGRNSKGRNYGGQEDKQERRLRKLEGEAKRKAWQEGRCLGCGEKGHLIAACPKVRYAKRILKRLDRAVKEGHKPKGAQKDKEGKPKKQLRFSATKEGSEEGSGPSEAEEEEEDPSEESSPSEDQEESGNDSPGSD
jgi:hypothetical protein